MKLLFLHRSIAARKEFAALLSDLMMNIDTVTIVSINIGAYSFVIEEASKIIKKERPDYVLVDDEFSELTEKKTVLKTGMTSSDVLIAIGRISAEGEVA